MRTRRTYMIGLSLAACLGISLLLSSCSPGPSQQPSPLPPSQQVLRLGLVTGGNDINTLDPAQSSSFGSGSGFITSLIFPPLLTEDDRLNLEPWAATSMPTFDPAANTYTFKIRSGLTWSDGTPIDASTYAYSLNRSLSPCTASGVAFNLYQIKDAQAFSPEFCGSDGVTIKGKIQSLIGDSITVPDRQTLIIKLAAPAPYFLVALTTPVAFAQPEQLIDRYGPHAWIEHLTDYGGFGGNLFQVTSWNHKKGTLDLATCLSRCGASSGWGTHPAAPPLRNLEVHFYQTTQDEQAAYQAGVLDVGALPSTTYDTLGLVSTSLSAGPGFTSLQVPTLQITSLQLNWAKPPFTDLRVRQAFALALNKDDLAKLLGLFPTNHIVPQGMPGYDSKLVGPDETMHTTGNVPLARQLLQSYADDFCHGQFSKCPPVFMLNCFGGDSQYYLAAVQEAILMWQRAFPGYPVSGATESICGGLLVPFGSPSPVLPQVFSVLWTADYADAQDWLSLQFGRDAINNVGSVDVPTANALLAEADQTLDPTERTALYNQAEQLLVSNGAWIPIGQSLTYYTVRSSVAGFALTGLGYPSLDQWYGIQMVKQ